MIYMAEDRVSMGTLETTGNHTNMLSWHSEGSTARKTPHWRDPLCQRQLCHCMLVVMTPHIDASMGILVVIHCTGGINTCMVQRVKYKRVETPSRLW